MQIRGSRHPMRNFPFCTEETINSIMIKRFLLEQRVSKPLISRFTIFEIPEYTYEEFEAISVRIIKKLNQNAIIQMASSVWKTGSKDIREIAKLCNATDTQEDITRLICIHH